MNQFFDAKVVDLIPKMTMETHHASISNQKRQSGNLHLKEMHQRQILESQLHLRTSLLTKYSKYHKLPQIVQFKRKYHVVIRKPKSRQPLPQTIQSTHAPTNQMTMIQLMDL